MLSSLTLFLLLSHKSTCQLITQSLFKTEIKCGDTLTGQLDSSWPIDYYYFQLFQTSTVLFDSCGSTFDTLLRLYNDADFVELDYGILWNCGQPTQLVQQLNPGNYTFEIGSYNYEYGTYNLSVACKRCNTVECWNNYHHFENSIINHDAGFDQTGVAYWNSTLFIIGSNQIHYTEIKLFDSDLEYNWHHTTYNNNKSIRWNARLYAQYQSTVYMVAGIINGSDVLISIDLSSKQIKFTEYPPTARTVAYAYIECIVAGSDFVYGITNAVIMGIPTAKWDTLNANTEYQVKVFDHGVTPIITCAMTNDDKYIYIFTALNDFPILKYETSTTSITYLNASSLCSTDSWMVRSVTGRNGKMYLHGCDTFQWKTLIFDPNTELFENETIDINMPFDIEHINDLGYYSSGQLTIVDDNVLLLLLTQIQRVTVVSLNASFTFDIFNNFSWYSAVTDLISINFKNVETDNIWPSDGFEINYYLNDFSNSTNGIYYILFYSNDTSNVINKSIILNTSQDNCICNESIYNCYNCKQHFHLTDCLTLNDNNIDQLTIVPMHQYVNNNQNLLFVPQSIEIKLQRCEISFDSIDTTATSDYPSIKFHYWLSSNCHDRVGANFSLSIIGPKVNISKQLIISIINHNVSTHILCDTNSKYNCVNFNDNQFVINLVINGLNDTEQFHIYLKPDMIDFMLNSSPQNSIQYYKNQHTNINTTKINSQYLYLIFLVIIPCIILLLWAMCCRKQYMSAFVVDKALVLIIGISQFDDKRSFLPGVKQNVDDLVELWCSKYKYDVFVCNRDLLYSTKKDVIDFVDIHKTKLQDTSYGAVIVHIISHGSDNIFKTSDFKTFNLEFIKHELITKATEDNNLRLIKLIFHHGCQGDADYSAISENRLDKLSIINEQQTQNENQENQQYQQYQTRGILNIIRTSIISDNSAKMTHDSNCMVICGNISGRTMSDSGNFTKCICEAFTKNLKKPMKSDFNAIMVEIGRNLELKTNHAEICQNIGSLRFPQIRFEKHKTLMRESNELDDLEMVENSVKYGEKYKSIQNLNLLKVPLL